MYEINDHWTPKVCQPSGPYVPMAKARFSLGRDLASWARKSNGASSWCFDLGQDASGGPLRVTLPIGAIEPATSVNLGHLDDRAGKYIDFEGLTGLDLSYVPGSTELASFSFGSGLLRRMVAGALSLIANTSGFFNTWPSNALPGCSWSSTNVRRVLTGTDRLRFQLNTASWGRSQSGTAPGVTIGDVSHLNLTCPVDVQGYHFGSAAGGTGAVRVSTQASQICRERAQAIAAGDPRPAGCPTMGEWRGIVTICMQQRTMASARLFDYWLWASQVIHRADTRLDYIAARAQKLALTYLIEVAGDLLHEMSHSSILCGGGHCCGGSGEEATCPTDPTTAKYDCGHDLPKVLWKAWVRWFLDLPLPWRTSVPTDGSWLPAAGTFPAFMIAARIPKPTVLPRGPFSLDRYAHYGSSVGSHCGCVNQNLRDEILAHSPESAVDNPFIQMLRRMPCGYQVTLFDRRTRHRRAQVYWSINPLCTTSDVFQENSVGWWTGKP